MWVFSIVALLRCLF